MKEELHLNPKKSAELGEAGNKPEERKPLSELEEVVWIPIEELETFDALEAAIKDAESKIGKHLAIKGARPCERLGQLEMRHLEMPVGSISDLYRKARYVEKSCIDYISGKGGYRHQYDDLQALMMILKNIRDLYEMEQLHGS